MNSNIATRPFKLFSLPLILLLSSCMLCVGCGGDEDGSITDDRVTIRLQNLSDFFIHLLGPGEFQGSENLLDPFDADPSTGGDVRFISIRFGTPAITIRAVSGGELIDEIACEVPGGGLTDATFLDVFYGNSGFTCSLT